jgi:cobalt/nickel transport system ATP-binding protein
MVHIRIEHLSFSYPDGTLALNDIGFSVTEGESVGIIGANGAGKTTLILHLNGILRGNGLVEIAGVPVNERTLLVVRRKVGIVFQNPDEQLFSPTVYEDVAFAPLYMGKTAPEIGRIVSESLTAVGMAGYEEKMPHHLSVGEKKKIAIAAVLAQQPEILAFDEPSANLDPKSRRILLNLLLGFPHTRIIASHDFNVLKELCKRTIVLKKGMILADGLTEEILNDAALLKEADLL